MNTAIRRLGILALVLGAAAQGTTGPSGEWPPKFADYPARDTLSGSPAPVDLSSQPGARRFRTVLREGAKGGPNFAGYCTLVIWGCGSNCQDFAVIDGRSGRILEWGDSTFGVDFRKDSRLLVVNPVDEENESMAHHLGVEPEYFVLEKGALHSVIKP